MKRGSKIRNWTEEETNFLKENYPKGFLKEIKEKINRSNRSIANKACRLSLDRLCIDQASRIKTKNEDFFKVPTVRNSYWAGLISADGSITGHKLTLGLKTEDGYLIEQFKNEVGFEGKLSILKPYSAYSASFKYQINCSGQVKISLRSRKIVQDLYINFNIIPKKSLTLEPPKNLGINESLSFIKGNLDGNGSIFSFGKYYRISFCGTGKLMEWIKFTLKSVLDLGNPSVRKVTKIYHLNFGSKDSIKIHKLLSSIDTPCLRRKWDKIPKELWETI